MVQWITDRLPEQSDCRYIGNHFAVWVCMDDGKVVPMHYQSSKLKLGMPWMRIVDPEPYIWPKSRRFKPKDISGYYIVTSTCEHTFFRCLGDAWEKNHYKSGNCFEKEAQAQEAARRVRQVLSDYQDELLNGPTARETVWNKLAKFHEWFHGGGYEKIVAVALAASIVLGVATIIRKSLCSQ